MLLKAALIDIGIKSAIVAATIAIAGATQAHACQRVCVHWENVCRGNWGYGSYCHRCVVWQYRGWDCYR